MQHMGAVSTTNNKQTFSQRCGAFWASKKGFASICMGVSGIGVVGGAMIGMAFTPLTGGLSVLLGAAIGAVALPGIMLAVYATLWCIDKNCSSSINNEFVLSSNEDFISSTGQLLKKSPPQSRRVLLEPPTPPTDFSALVRKKKVRSSSKGDEYFDHFERTVRTAVAEQEFKPIELKEIQARQRLVEY